jgi:nucleoside diphosphate kinase
MNQKDQAESYMTPENYGYREEIPLSHISCMIIKPGFEDHLGDIAEILRVHGLETLYSSTYRLRGSDVDSMYSDDIGQHYYEDMKAYLTERDIVACLVLGGDENTHSLLSSLKKAPDGQDGLIRTMFQKDERVLREEIEIWNRGEHSNQRDLTVTLTQRNVIHVSDTIEQSHHLIRLLLGDLFDSLKMRGMLPLELQQLSEAMR